MDTPPIISDFAEVIQLSLAPVFLLAGTAAFVNIYATRLARVSDRLNEVSDRKEQSKQFRLQLAYLRRRALTLETAVVLGVMAGICTGAATLNLLLGALAIGLRQENLFWFFGGAIVSLILSLLAFLFELLTAGRNMLRQIRMDGTAAEQEQSSITNGRTEHVRSAMSSEVRQQVDGGSTL